ncbi:MAG: SMP-30/gluconolactonase/LRE family protein [Pirellulales bacterium]
MQEIDARCIFDGKATLGEGPAWIASTQQLIWVDIERHLINRFEPATGKNESRSVGCDVGFAVPDKSGNIVAGTRDGIIRLNTTTGEITSVIDPESDIPTNRFNDGKCDPRGRIFGGSISYNRIVGDASLYRINTDFQVEKVVENVTNSNGLTWSLDEKTFYYIDTPTRKVDAFDYDVETGAISNRRTIIKVPEELGKPDGMTIDNEGMLWVCLWGGWGVTRWNPESGELIGKINLPCKNVTSCCFGGPNLDQLFITCARTGLSAEELTDQPQAGSLFMAEPGVSGQAAVAFAG